MQRGTAKDAAAALDDVLAEALASNQEDFQQSLEGIQRGYEDVKARRTRPASEFLAEMRRKYGFSSQVNR
jgi:hypothetical protein